EVLRHPRIRRVTMVDIDGEVVEFCRKYLARWHQGALDHKKTRLLIADARTFVAETHEQFDIIISDLPTPRNSQEAVAPLYTLAFYRQTLRRLKPGGIFAAQAGSGHWLHLQFHTALQRTLRKVFQVVRPYYAFVPSFDEPWAFVIASQNTDPLRRSSSQIDQRLGALKKSLRFYDGQTHE